MDARLPRVLVVDDDKLMREVLKAILRSEKFAISGEAWNGEAALSHVERYKPDIVCLDINMEGMSGIDALKAIRDTYPEIKVVMISGDASAATVRDAVSLGALGYIIKPFNAARVAATLRAAMKAPTDSPFG
jgi:two-component system, chemotaxis family, chemotaxis protein CheY